MSTLPVAEFELRGGGRLRLYSNRLVHEGRGALVEIMPYAHLASVRVAFERDAKTLNWTVGLALAALALAALSGPMQGWFVSLAKGAAGESSHSEALVAIFNALGAFARMLPAIALGLAVIAAVVGAFFVLGRTTLTLHFAATERAFGALGDNRRLIEFAEILGERLAERGE